MCGILRLHHDGSCGPGPTRRLRRPVRAEIWLPGDEGWLAPRRIVGLSLGLRVSPPPPLFSANPAGRGRWEGGGGGEFSDRAGHVAGETLLEPPLSWAHDPSTGTYLRARRAAEVSGRIRVPAAHADRGRLPGGARPVGRQGGAGCHDASSRRRSAKSFAPMPTRKPQEGLCAPASSQAVLGRREPGSGALVDGLAAAGPDSVRMEAPGAGRGAGAPGSRGAERLRPGRGRGAPHKGRGRQIMVQAARMLARSPGRESNVRGQG